VDFQPAAEYERNVRKYKRNKTKRETIHKTTQEHRIYKTENKNTKLNTNIKDHLKNTSRVIRK
jgi:hypothetical protein